MATTVVTPTPSQVDCGAIAAGTLLALAISAVLIPFGNALGLSFSSFVNADTITMKSIIIIGLWTLWVQLMASMAGAYLAGRFLRTAAPNTHESELRDGAHGLIVWALSTVLMAVAVGVTAFWAALAAQHGVEPTHADMSDEMMRKMHIITGFSIAASSLVSAAAAWAMGAVAGDHRDSNSDVSHYVTFRRNRKK